MASSCQNNAVKFKNTYNYNLMSVTGWFLHFQKCHKNCLSITSSFLLILMNYRCYFLSNAKFNGSHKYSDISGIILHIHIEAETYTDTLNYNLQLS